MPQRPSPHPVVWTVLSFPFGALGGFVTVALTFLATRHGLSITEGAMLGAASLVSQWLKWTWAPILDVSLTPRRWYVIAVVASAAGVLGMAAVPLSRDTLGLLLAIIVVASVMSSIVGMAVGAMVAAVTPFEQIGRTSAWLQAGGLGGTGIGGGLGLLLLEALPQPWMAGALLGLTFLTCVVALVWVPDFTGHRHEGGPLSAVRGVLRDVASLSRTRGGLLAGSLCFLPVGHGAAAGILTQAEVAATWNAGDTEVALLQGVIAGLVTTLGCFAGGWLCGRFQPRVAYVGNGLALACAAVGMALTPTTVVSYVGWTLVYTFGVGLSYATFTALVLRAIGVRSAATKYNLFLSLSNFPAWWLGLTLGRVADVSGARSMLLADAALGIVGVGMFVLLARRIARTSLPETLADDGPLY